MNLELKECYNKVMKESINMALATSVDDQPNVRIVTFGYDEKQEGKIYFSTFKGCNKIKEFAVNPKIACIPLPLEPEAEAQVRIFGQVAKSEMTLQELIGLISPKAQGDAETLMSGGEMMEIYEVSFSEAWVTIGMTEAVEYRVNP